MRSGADSDSPESVCRAYARLYAHTYIHTYSAYIYNVTRSILSVLGACLCRCLGAVGSFVGKVEAWLIESITGTDCQVKGQSEGLSFLYVFLSDV